MTRVAVIIVNYNAGDMLHECLAALARQTVKPARVLVIDNGSRDGSVERCETDFSWVEFHRMNANLGFARANNIAAELASDCEWLALLNPDAFADPRWLETFLDGTRRYPATDVFASCMLSANRPGLLDGAGDSYRTDGVAWPRFQHQPVERVPRESEEVFAPCGGAGFYRRSVFLQAGGFSERYFCYHEDVDLGFRLRLFGHRCRLLPEAMVRHVGSAVAGKGSDFSVYHVHRNMVWTYMRNMPSPYFWVHLPAHLATNVLSMCVHMLRGQGRVIWRAKRDALCALPQIWRERRAIQQKRRVPASVVTQCMERGTVFGSMARRAFRSLRRRFATA